jgi:hypothetical protein
MDSEMNNMPLILGDRNVKSFTKEHSIWRKIDIFQDQLKELFEINNPRLLNSNKYDYKLQEYLKDERSHPKAKWIYFPWNGELVHCINEKDYLKLRTNRNRNLITKSEQTRLYNSCIGVIGLSVGSGIAIGLAYQGIARDLKLAEHDTLETTNLNRIKARLSDIGQAKIEIIRKQIYEINPFQKIHSLSKGINNLLLKGFIQGKPKPRVIFEIVDDFEMKIRVRMEARRAGIPVIGPANLGDRILWDIERYDLDNKLPLLNGVLGKLPEKILENPDEDQNKYAVAMVEPKNIPKRAINSVGQIGKTLVGRPQLSSTVTISGALGVYVARKIILGHLLPSGRYLVDLDKLFKI